MKSNSRKIAIVFGLFTILACVFSISASAEKVDFVPTIFSDITRENGWVQLASQSAMADADGKNIELYYVAGAEAYLNKKTKTLAFVGKNCISGNYGDWLVNSTKNTPGCIYYLAYWPVLNSEQVEHIEFRNCNEFYNTGYVLQQFKHVKTIKINETGYYLHGSKSDTGLCTGMTSLTTLGHGAFLSSGKFIPLTYKEGVIDLRGFTYLKPMTGSSDSKAALYAGHIFYGCASINEVIMPRRLSGSGTYKPAVYEDGKWVASSEEIYTWEDEFGGEYAGVFAKGMFRNAVMLAKITIPEGVELKAFEKDALNGCVSLCCIDVNGTVSPTLKIESGAFKNVAEGCIIRCARSEDIAVVNKALTDAGFTSVKATDMSVEPRPVPEITKLPAAPSWTEVDPATLGATAYGSMKSTYTDNWWAYFQDTKTLKFFAKRFFSYNEVGNLGQCTDGVGWSDYLDEIEHVVIGPDIHKLTATCFTGMTNLKDIEMTADITWATGTFEDVPNLTTIFVTGMEKVEGQAMLAGAKNNCKLNFSGSAVQSIHMGSSSWNFVGNIIPGPKTTTLIYDDPKSPMIEYCKENNLILKDPSGGIFAPIPDGLPGGDVNGDGITNAKDAVLLAQYLAGWNVSYYSKTSDCNGDSAIDAKDAVILAQHLAGWSVHLE